MLICTDTDAHKHTLIQTYMCRHTQRVTEPKHGLLSTPLDILCGRTQTFTHIHTQLPETFGMPVLTVHTQACLHAPVWPGHIAIKSL